MTRLLSRGVRQLASLGALFVGLTLVTFVLLHAAPGDPAEVRGGTARGVSAESLRALRSDYELDRPLVAQYGSWLSRSLLLDFGRSFVDGRPVRDKLVERAPV